MWSIDPIQIHVISYIHINIYRTCTQKVGLVEETKGGGQKGKKDSKKIIKNIIFV
jgi:hypothetical protein